MSEDKICKVCGDSYTWNSKKGLCRSCAAKASVTDSGKVCSKCGKPIKASNEEGICYNCKDYKPKRKYTFSKDNPWFLTNMAICWNKNCRKKFYISKNQDPRYSLCPACKAIRHEMSATNWISRGHEMSKF